MTCQIDQRGNDAAMVAARYRVSAELGPVSQADDNLAGLGIDFMGLWREERMERRAPHFLFQPRERLASRILRRLRIH
jgi:hypothetical protein